MTCEEFQAWFVYLLEEDAPPDFPEEAYRRHVVSCERCRLTHSLPDYEAKLGEIVSSFPPAVPDETCARIVANARKRAGRHRWTVRLEWAAAILILAGGAFLLRSWRAGSDCEPCRETARAADSAGLPPAPEREAKVPPPIVDVARGLQSEGFELASARQAKSDRNLLLLYTRTDENADPYEFARSVALSNCAALYPDAPLLTVTVMDEEKTSLLQAQFPTDELAEKKDDPDLLLLPGRDFCLRFRILHEESDLSDLKGE